MCKDVVPVREESIDTLWTDHVGLNVQENIRLSNLCGGPNDDLIQEARPAEVQGVWGCLALCDRRTVPTQRGMVQQSTRRV